jgi:hypothetical protein
MSKLVMHRPPTFDLLLSHHIDVAINITAARLAPVIGDSPMYSPKVIIHTRIVNMPVHLTKTQFRAYGMSAASPSASIRGWTSTARLCCQVLRQHHTTSQHTAFLYHRILHHRSHPTILTNVAIST